jgi:hypothetical protein
MAVCPAVLGKGPGNGFHVGECRETGVPELPKTEILAVEEVP